MAMLLSITQGFPLDGYTELSYSPRLNPAKLGSESTPAPENTKIRKIFPENNKNHGGPENIFRMLLVFSGRKPFRIFLEIKNIKLWVVW